MGNSLTFGPVNSSDFDVVISGEGVFDAPKKDVEKVAIPGRNGDLIIDRNRYENIIVSYPAYYYKPNMFDFRSVLDNFRSALASQRGYQRLEDTFHPDEFRLGMFADGFEVDPVKYNTAARFNIDFDCKPQRFLKSGEVPQEFDADGSIYNPTQYEAAPLLAVEGRGEIVLNGYPIEINIDPLGRTPLFNSVSGEPSVGADFDQNVPYNTGDTIEVESSTYTVIFRGRSGYALEGATISSHTGDLDLYYTNRLSNGDYKVSMLLNKQTFTDGTSAMKTATLGVTLLYGNSSEDVTITLRMTYFPDVVGERITLAGVVTTEPDHSDIVDEGVYLNNGYIDSSASSVGETLMIDCEIGEVYVGEQSYNNAVSLGTNLPRLSPGANAFTLANTIDKLTIIPRWWRI
ncbi:MAG: phage tail family protein [Clostridiales bacterium]|nr:phage tail family protein [Clostridiales bacterium]MBQ1572247.1 phage tail family protein [Clostridiales bacterium]